MASQWCIMLKILFNECTVLYRIIFIIYWSYNPQDFCTGWFGGIHGNNGNSKCVLIPRWTLTGQLLCQKYDRGGSNHNVRTYTHYVHISSWGHVFCLRYLLSHKDKKKMPLPPPKNKEIYNKRAASVSVSSAAKQTHIALITSQWLAFFHQEMSSHDKIPFQ